MTYYISGCAAVPARTAMPARAPIAACRSSIAKIVIMPVKRPIAPAKLFASSRRRSSSCRRQWLTACCRRPRNETRRRMQCAN